MINELFVLKRLKRVIETEINDHIVNSEERDILNFISDKNVCIEFPNVDLMPSSSVIYLQPNSADYETYTTESDNSTFTIDVFILCKRDNQENLSRKVYGYFQALYSLLRRNTSLGGAVDFCDIKNATFYPAVENNMNIQGVNAEITIRYTKDF